MQSGIGFVLEVTTSVVAGLHCIEVMVPLRKGQLLFLGTCEQRLELVRLSDTRSWSALQSARRVVLNGDEDSHRKGQPNAEVQVAVRKAPPKYGEEDSHDTTRPELSEKRPNQEARTPVYSSYDAEESNLIGTPVAQQTKIIRKAPLPHCDEKSLSHGAAGCQTDQTNNKKKQHNARHHVANHRQWCTC